MTTQYDPSPNLHQHALEPHILTAGQLDGIVWWHHHTLPEWKLTLLSLNISRRKNGPSKREINERDDNGENSKCMHIFMHILCTHTPFFLARCVCVHVYVCYCSSWFCSVVCSTLNWLFYVYYFVQFAYLLYSFFSVQACRVCSSKIKLLNIIWLEKQQ